MTTFSTTNSRAFARVFSLFATVVGAHADPVLIDFSSATPEPGVTDSNGNRWTTIGEAGTINDLIDATGTATAIDITVDFSRFSAGLGGNAIDGPTGPPPFDQTFAVVDGIFSSRTIGVATVTLSDLASETPYNLSMIGGRATVGVDGTIEVITGTGSGGTLLNDGTILDLTLVSDSSGVIAFTFIDFDDDNTNGATLNAMSFSQSGETGPQSILKVSQNAEGLDFEWISETGMEYHLVSSTDLTTDPATWTPYDDGAVIYEDIAASGTGTNTLTAVAPTGPVRFFALLGEPVSP